VVSPDSSQERGNRIEYPFICFRFSRQLQNMANVGAFGFLDIIVSVLAIGYWHGSCEELRISVTLPIGIHTEIVKLV
jgi:hypothetical protein